MKKLITIGSQYRQGCIQGKTRDLPFAPKLVLANHFLKDLSGFEIGDKVVVQYLPEVVIIRKSNLKL